ncbi:MAG: beta-L-arabinofuranosidase domain-containing protein [Vicinamibacterales bacterium]
MKLLAALPLISVLVLSAPVGVGTQPGRATETATKAPPRLQAFDLREVRLLDGPFRDAMLRDQKFLLGLDPARLLHSFRLTAGLESGATPYGGWEAPEVELRGHTLGHYLSALALMYRASSDERFKARAEQIVAELAKIQAAAVSSGFNAGYLSAFPEEFFDRVEKRQRVWAPYYTLHKIMAGLLDVHSLCENQQALAVASRMGDWVGFRMRRLNEDQRQLMLETEFGGMSEALANLYAATGDSKHLETARMFDHRALFDQLAKGVDPLDGLHGNTQIPKAIGAVREYEFTGEKRYRDIAAFFWERVALHRSYVIGGNTDDERFFPVGHFSRHLTEVTAETCNTYNMLKLTRALFLHEPSVQKMDFYERGLFNHILASQDPSSGMMCYYVPLRPASFKTYNTPEDSFWCCTGTGMENHAKYGDTIYFHDANSLYVNLFVPSEVTWREKGVVVRQETSFPDNGFTELSFKAQRPVRFSVRVRYPAWASKGITLYVNGAWEDVETKPGTYVSVDREWKNGDRLRVEFPLSLRAETLPGDRQTVAVLYGPIVLAGDLGTDGLEAAKRFGVYAPETGRLKTPVVPSFIGDAGTLVSAIKPVAGAAPLTFSVPTPGRPVTLVPFYRMFEHRYTVYWKVYSQAEWSARREEREAIAERRADIQRRTLDTVSVDDPANEEEHAYKGQGTREGWLEGVKYREASGGWMSWDLAVSFEPMAIVCTYRGEANDPREFDILVDGENLVTESIGHDPHPTIDREYRLPESMVQGKERITVRFEAAPGKKTAGIFDVRTVRR